MNKSKIKNNLFLKFIFLSSAASILSCGQTAFTPAENSALNNTVLFEDNFKTANSEINYTQPNLDENKTAVSFQIQNSLGLLLQNLSKSEMRLTENGKPVTDFTLNKNSVTNVATADIIFAVDVTGSMGKTIEAAKKRLVDFVKSTRAQGYHTRMCISTFGDFTVKKCSRFYDNDPKESSTEIEVAELISEITKLKALTGAQDPGGMDFDENPMRAVIDAASAPWGDNSQRFLILITDAGFLYSPGNSGRIGAGAPQFSEVSAAISQSKMKIFAVTPSLAGYDKKFGTDEGIVNQSQGEWYRYSDLVSGAITLNTVLGKILSSIDTTFYLHYTLNAQSHLDPTKPLAQRNIQIEILDTTLGVIKSLLVTSNLPNGRIPDPKRFLVADKDIKTSELKVYVNDVLQNGNYNILLNREIEFFRPQLANSKIKIKYKYQAIRDAITLRPLNVSVGADKVSLLKFTINNISVDAKYYEVIPGEMNLSTIVFSDDIFAQQDPFKIIETQEMNVLIKTK